MTVLVRPVTLAELAAYQRDPGEFGALLGCPVPAGWPEFPESVEFTAGQFREHPDQAPWWMQLFLVDDTLVGSGGFVGPPVDDVVEIGYEIAPEFRGRGYATEAAQAMIDRARVGGANTVVAHTLAQHNPSTGVLQKLGFGFVGELPDDENGAIWRWELTRGDGTAA